MSKLITIAQGAVAFFCPGCNEHHTVQVAPFPHPPVWGYNNNPDAPTFTPSILVRGHRMTDKGRADWEAWHDAGHPKPVPEFERQDLVCHSFVTDGRIQYLGDCTHAMAGQTVDLPDTKPHHDDTE